MRQLQQKENSSLVCYHADSCTSIYQYHLFNPFSTGLSSTVTYTQDIQAKKSLFSSEKWKFLIIFTLAPPFLRIIGAISWKFPLPVSDDWFVTALPITGNWTRNPALSSPINNLSFSNELGKRKRIIKGSLLLIFQLLSSNPELLGIWCSFPDGHDHTHVCVF